MTDKPHSSRPATPTKAKPAKPYPEFPLYAHASGRWAKTIRGRFVYFGPWADPDAALQKHLAEKDALHAGLTPADTSEGLTIYHLCAKFLTPGNALVLAAPLRADWSRAAPGIRMGQNCSPSSLDGWLPATRLRWRTLSLKRRSRSWSSPLILTKSCPLSSSDNPTMRNCSWPGLGTLRSGASPAPVPSHEL